mmetsp:Transcript_5807/g.6749  ORF Transcript_5807/g.6749 Transcript_5807/m.6749 type:complete len:457 (+) Transcript_5807:192-1562(+)|eukprot:CAMPEP_0198269774 /NCGR_PEP_ID=MMETSP1447-20131203/42516_1 /TAXON_ID=420782 /ORGANISM="Chaetoceros dichaeta, Strain CCMP1751" /LENGTH=456 /DNA_ID=CAMNT_0043961493 /DNA_START=126 /DNA_END=1496 /DNA_ORIENTATION=+
MRVNFIYQSKNRRHGEKLARVVIEDNDDKARKKVKDALEALHKRNIPATYWGVKEVRVSCSVLKADRLDCNGEQFILTDDDALHLSYSPEHDYVVVVDKEEQEAIVVDRRMEHEVHKEVNILKQEEDTGFINEVIEGGERLGLCPRCNQYSYNNTVNMCGTCGLSRSYTPRVDAVLKIKNGESKISDTNSDEQDSDDKINDNEEEEIQCRSDEKVKEGKAVHKRRSYAVGSVHYICSKGLDYRVRITKCLRTGRFQVKYDNYRSLKSVNKEDLLEATSKRDSNFKNACATSQEAKKVKKEQEKVKKEAEHEQVMERKQRQKQSTKRRILTNRKLSKEQINMKRIEENKTLSSQYGKYTKADDIPVRTDCSGKVLLQPDKKRRLYYAIENDTPRKISKKFGIDVERIIYDNRQLIEYKDMLETSKLRQNSVIIVPLTSRVSKKISSTEIVQLLTRAL